MSLEEDVPVYAEIREAKNLLQLSHPHIVRAYSWWLEPRADNNSSYLFLQMEYVGSLLTGPVNLYSFVKARRLDEVTTQKRQRIREFFT